MKVFFKNIWNNKKYRAIAISILAILIGLGVAIPIAVHNTGKQPVSGQPNRGYHTVTFVTNSDSSIPTRQIADQACLEKLPNAKKINNIFDGWFYEDSFATPVKSTDVVTKDITLYAKFENEPEIDSKETPSAIVKNNVDVDFKILIANPSGYSLEDAKKYIDSENLLDSKVEAMRLSMREDGLLELSFTQQGFDAGVSYKVKLSDDNMYFEGENPDVKEYNFTTTATPLNNMKYMDDITYLSVEEFSDIVINGKLADSFSISLFSIYQNGELVSNEEITGSFKSAATLAIGSVVTLYDGVRPDKRTVDTPVEQCGDVAYVEITGYDKASSTYLFKKAEAEEVIFIPDMLPLNIKASNVIRKGDKFIINKEALNYSEDSFAFIGLDSQTTVDAGDFFVLYEGDFDYTNSSAVSYVEILSVETIDDKYTVTVSENKDWDYVSQAMDIYNTQNQDLAKDMDEEMVSKIEQNVAEQAVNSGFANEAGMYLASLTLATDTFKTLSGDMDLEDYRIILDDGTPLSPEQVQLMANGSRVEVSKPNAKAKLSTELKEFEGVDGLRLTLSISTVITIHLNEEADVKIEITGDFVQELRLDLGMRAKAIWKVWGVFPYISEYKINADIDLYEYTGISFRADITTSETEADSSSEQSGNNKIFNTAAKSLANELKKLMEKFKGSDDTDSDEEISISTSLSEKYKEMLENESDWVELYSYPMVRLTTMLPPCCPIVAIEFEADFVISANANVSLGIDFYYKNAKRYNYTIDLFARKVTNNVINLVEEQYELDAYVMGTLGLRAGIRFELKIGLFSTDLDSVGFKIEAGAYIKLYGYFYYNLSYTESEGRSQYHLGAMYMEIGVYLEVGVEAQVLGGKYSTEATLYEEEWPLLSVGRQENVQNFIIAQENYDDIKLKQYIRQAIIPDSYFKMSYLDLKEGKDGNKTYSDNPSDGEFTIKIDNSKFSYDYKTNTITVSPDDDDIKLEAEMTITWNAGPLAFTSTPIRRTIKITWDNLRDGYVIVPYTNGGSYVPIIMGEYEADITIPENPIRTGYVFKGWYSDENLTIPYIFPEKMGNTDTNIYAKWEEATDTPYRVRFYQQNVDSDEYTLVKTFEGSGKTNSTVTPETEVYEGFNTPETEELLILADGSAVIDYYYTRVINHVTFTPGSIIGDDDVYEYKYGAKVSAPVFAAAGYIFKGWDKDVEPIMGAQDVVYTAQWETASDTKYRLEYYVQDENGTYRLNDTIFAQGETGSIILLDNIAKKEQYESEIITLERITVNGINVWSLGQNPAIAADGKTVVKIFYGRVKNCDVTYVLNNGQENCVEQFYLGETLRCPELTRDGYIFKGWYTDAELKNQVADNAVATIGLTLYARWEMKSSICIKHYVMDITGNYGLTPVYSIIMDTVNGKEYAIPDMLSDDILVADGIVFDYAICDGLEVVEKVAAKEGESQVAIYYKRMKYHLSWDLGDGTATSEYSSDGMYYYEEPIVAPTPKKHGFWYEFDILPPTSMPAQDLAISVIWTETDKISVQFVDYDNRVLDEKKGYVGSPVGTTTVKGNRPGYTFLGWDREIPDYFGEENVIIKAVYSICTYGIDYELNGGMFNDSDVVITEYDAETNSVIIPTPTKRGYTFMGWYDNKELSGVAITKLEKGSIGDRTFYAKWSENHYRIQFIATDADNTLTVDVDNQATLTLGYEDAAKLIANPYFKTDSQFIGWATYEGGAVVYDDEESITKLCEEDGAVLKLYAVFLQGYHIYYQNLVDGSMAEDVTSFFNPLSSDITLDAPAINRTGYSFDGWYTSDDYRESSKLTILTPSSIRNNVVLYAKWSANTYAVIFDANLKSGTGEDTQLLTYDTSKPLASFSSMNFENPGYTFQGWTTEQNSGRVDFTDGETVLNLATHGNFRIYAVWAAVQYNISYSNWNDIATNNSNETEFYVTTDDIILEAPTELTPGYKFLGWYDTVSDEKITRIQKGSHKNISLKAKWSHVGTFALSYVSTSGGESTYKITRTIPEGAQVDSDTQYVYYRTENGTAIGGTATAINFKHVGGEDAYVAFTAADGNGTEKTFKVVGESSRSVFNSAKPVSEYSGQVIKQGTAAKYYKVRIYKVLNTQGGLTGFIDEAKKEYKRTIPENCDTISDSLFKEEKISSIDAYTGGEITITDDGYDSNWSFTETLGKSGIIRKAYSSYNDTIRGYIARNISKYAYSITFSVKEVNDGYQYVKFKLGSEYIVYKFSDETSSDTYTPIYVPCSYAQGDGKINAMVDPEEYIGPNLEGSGEYVYFPASAGSIQVQFDASGTGSDDWKLKNISQLMIPIDQTKATQIGIAPMAFGQYKANDKIIVPVVFSEIINGCTAPSDLVSRLASAGIPVKSASLLNAYGTNVVCIEVTLSNDITVDENLNNKLYSNTSILNGFVTDLVGNR